MPPGPPDLFPPSPVAAQPRRLAMAGSSASPQPGGFFLQACLPSPAPSAASARSTAGLPRPRRDALRPGSSKEALVRRFVEEQLLNTACRYVKKFAPPDPADPVVGFANFGQVSRELDGIVASCARARADTSIQLASRSPSS